MSLGNVSSPSKPIKEGLGLEGSKGRGLDQLVKEVQLCRAKLRIPNQSDRGRSPRAVLAGKVNISMAAPPLILQALAWNTLFLLIFSRFSLILLQLLFLPFQAFLVFPPLAIFVGLGFRAIHRGRGGERGAAGTAAVLWMAYGVYECYISWIWSPSHIAPIRADLFLIAPILYMISFFAILTGSSNNQGEFPPESLDLQVTPRDCAGAQTGIKAEMLPSPITCPECNYLRQSTDDAPEWQCPKCQKAYRKTARRVES